MKKQFIAIIVIIGFIVVIILVFSFKNLTLLQGFFRPNPSSVPSIPKYSFQSAFKPKAPSLPKKIADQLKKQDILSSFIILTRDKHYNLTTGQEVSKEKADISFTAGRGGGETFPFYFKKNLNQKSNSAVMYMGDGVPSSFSCPEFKLIPAPELPIMEATGGEFTYFINSVRGLIGQQVRLGGVYCLVNNDNTKIFRFKVTGQDANTVTITYEQMGLTGVKTYGYDDGFWNSNVEINCVGCKDSDLPSIQKTKQFEEQAKTCLNDYLGTNFSPLRMVIYPYKLTPCEAMQGGYCSNYGLGGPAMLNYGFVGVQDGGETKTRFENIRLELHENMHVYNNLAQLSFPLWFEEGFALQTDFRVECGPEANRMHRDLGDAINYTDLRDGVSTLDVSVSSNPQAIGRLFMRGLEIDYGCGKECMAKTWKRLLNNRSPDTAINNRQVKEAVEAETGRDTTPLFELLHLN